MPRAGYALMPRGQGRICTNAQGRICNNAQGRICTNARGRICTNAQGRICTNAQGRKHLVVSKVSFLVCSVACIFATYIFFQTVRHFVNVLMFRVSKYPSSVIFCKNVNKAQ